MDLFDLIAPLFDHSSWLENREEIISCAGLPVDGWLLDAGGGTGRVAFALRDLASGTVVADPSRGMVRRAGVKQGLNATQARAERLPFASGTFARVIMVDAFHHVFDQAETLRELWRVTQPGGRILLIEPDARRLTVRVLSLVEKALFLRSRMRPADEMVALLDQPGVRANVKYIETSAWVVFDKPTV
jgi:ubiquinone/menaquinone biosynthesis C-methylase UbiE